MGDPQSIRNIAVVSYPGAGKTSVAEALLYTAGAISSMGSVTAGNTVADFEPEEIRHHHSINSALLQFEWQGTTFNLLDTPGTLDFLADTKSALHAVDGVLIIIGASGIRTEIERVWEYIQERNLPCLLFINELDKPDVKMEETLEEVEKLLEIKTVPIAWPLKNGEALSGVANLIENTAVISLENSPKVQQAEIPDNDKSQIEEIRRQLFETVAEVNDQLVEKYLSQGTLDQNDLYAGLTEGTLLRSFVPMLCGSALQNIGMFTLLEALAHFSPTPLSRATIFPATGESPQSGESIQREVDTNAPLSAFVFKTTIDPFMGRMSYVRVHSGSLEADSTFFNAIRQSKEKGGHLYHLLGKKYTQIDRITAGDIGAIGKLKDTQTGDTICIDKHPIRFPGISLSRPVMSFALEPKSKADIDKVSLGLHKLGEEDPSLEFIRNDETKEMLLSGVGQTHIEMTLEKLHRKYGVDVQLHTPKVAYRETIQKMSQAQGKYKKQTGGHGQYGDCWLQIDPLPRGGGFEFKNKIVGGVIPRNFIPAVEKGVVEAMQEGFLAGFPIVDMSITVYDGSYHPVDSSEMAFKVAASMAMKKAMEGAQAILLEPIMTVEVTAPDEMVGAVIGDLNSRRGRILGMAVKGHNQVVKATVPLAEILKYAPTLNSLTAGKGSYVMEFSGYEAVPRELMTRVIEEHKGTKQAIHS